MATNVTVYDLENYPDNSKSVSIDLKTIVPVGGEGDEKWVLMFATNAYSDATERTAIQDSFVRDIKAGWCKSSGLVGVGGKYTIDSSSDTLGITIDAASTYYIVLETGTNLTGAAIASDMETKIRAIPDQGGFTDTTYVNSFRSASVTYLDGKFYIISGSVAQYYTGSDRTSVAVTASGVDTCYDTLGFNLQISSESVAGSAIKEVLITSNYTANTDTLSIATGTGVVSGNAMYITDGTNEDYFTAISGTTDTSVKVCTASNNSYTGISNSYTSGEAKVQVLIPGDPDNEPVPYYGTVDSVVRWGIKNITNQIDFSG